MDTFGPTILKQLQALSSRANTLLNRLMNDAAPTAHGLERDVRNVSYDLENITRSADQNEVRLIEAAQRAADDLNV